MANVLKREKQAQVISMLVEGTSIRSAERITGVHRDTIMRLMVSKKVENLKAAVALHLAWYNFVRLHRSLGMTPAMGAGIVSDIWTIERLLPN